MKKEKVAEFFNVFNLNVCIMWTKQEYRLIIDHPTL